MQWSKLQIHATYQTCTTVWEPLIHYVLIIYIYYYGNGSIWSGFFIICIYVASSVNPILPPFPYMVVLVSWQWAEETGNIGSYLIMFKFQSFLSTPSISFYYLWLVCMADSCWPCPYSCLVSVFVIFVSPCFPAKDAPSFTISKWSRS